MKANFLKAFWYHKFQFWIKVIIKKCVFSFREISFFKFFVDHIIFCPSNIKVERALSQHKCEQLVVIVVDKFYKTCSVHHDNNVITKQTDYKEIVILYSIASQEFSLFLKGG